MGDLRGIAGFHRVAEKKRTLQILRYTKDGRIAGGHTRRVKWLEQPPKPGETQQFEEELETQQLEPEWLRLRLAQGQIPSGAWEQERASVPTPGEHSRPIVTGFARTLVPRGCVKPIGRDSAPDPRMRAPFRRSLDASRGQGHQQE